VFALVHDYAGSRGSAVGGPRRRVLRIIPAAGTQFAAVDPNRPLEAGLGKIVRGRVERFFAWIGRNRRLAKDFEATIASARAFLYAASVMLLVRRLGRAS
jgi:hypothetical protein